MATPGTPQPKDGGGGSAWWKALLGAGLAERTMGLPFVGSFDEGTDYVPSDGLAMVHEGEAVVPKRQNRLLQMVNGGFDGAIADNWGGSGGSSSWAKPGDAGMDDLVDHGSSWSRPDPSRMDDLVARPGDKALAQPLSNRIQDDAVTRHNPEIANSTGDSFADEGAGEAQSLRAQMAQSMRSSQQPSRMDTLQQQYDQLGQQASAPPKKMGMLKALMLGALAGPKAGQAFQARQQGQQFQQNQLRERQNSLLQQIEAERRMQGEQDRLDQSEGFQERMGERQHEWSLDDPSKVQTIQTDRGTFQRDPRSGQWTPIQAGGQPIGGKAQPKPDSPEQQEIDYYMSKGMSLPQAIRQAAQDKQPPQRDPQQLAIDPDGTVVRLTPGAKVAPGTVTASQYGPEQTKLNQQGQTAQATLNSFTRYQSSFRNLAPQLTEDDRRAMQVLTSHEAVSRGFLDKAASGALDTLFGEPLTGYSEKAMGGIMTKDQYDKMSPAGKKMTADYFNAVIQNFGQMKQMMGSVGRNPMQLQAEINTIPLPYVDSQTADAMFQDKLEDLNSRNRNLPGFGNQGGGQNRQSLKDQVSNQAPEGTRIQVGNQIQVKRNGRWVPETQ